MPVTLPKSYSGSGLVLENIGLFVSLSSRLGVTLLWDGGIYVKELQFLKNKTTRIQKKTPSLGMTLISSISF